MLLTFVKFATVEYTDQSAVFKCGKSQKKNDLEWRYVHNKPIEIFCCS